MDPQGHETYFMPLPGMRTNTNRDKAGLVLQIDGPASAWAVLPYGDLS